MWFGLEWLFFALLIIIIQIRNGLSFGGIIKPQRDFTSSEETSNFSPEFVYRNLSSRGGQYYEEVHLIRLENNNVTNNICVENVFQADFDSVKVFPKLGFHVSAD
jgi:hypothetical protein